jgi:hypothetical protein
MEKELLTLDAKMLGALSTRPGGMTGVSKFAKIRTAVKIGAQFKGITLKDGSVEGDLTEAYNLVSERTSRTHTLPL